MDKKEVNILLVTHGKIIQQLFKMFFEEMNCIAAVPGIRNPVDLLDVRRFRSSCANTSWSKFIIEVCDEKPSDIKRIECQEIFNKKHLEDLE